MMCLYIPERQSFQSLPADSKRVLCTKIEDQTGFRFGGLGAGGATLATFYHKEFQFEAKLILADTFLMGLSESEEMAANALLGNASLDVSRMRPVHRAEVRPILVSTFPILPAEYQRVIGNPYKHDVYRHGEPVRLSFQAAERFADAVGGRLPSEAEWEYCCRGGTQSLFHWGDELPKSADELERLVCDKLRKIQNPRCNRFGMYCLFSGEWCAEIFRDSYENRSAVREGYHVVRGGAAELWPWQGDDWIWCISANRMGARAGKAATPQSASVVDLYKAMAPVEHALRIVWDL